MSVLLGTKLNSPTLPLKRIPRPQLTARLIEGLESGHAITQGLAPAADHTGTPT
jgi:hypothetical protein